MYQHDIIVARVTCLPAATRPSCDVNITKVSDGSLIQCSYVGLGTKKWRELKVEPFSVKLQQKEPSPALCTDLLESSFNGLFLRCEYLVDSRLSFRQFVLIHTIDVLGHNHPNSLMSDGCIS